MIKYIAILLLVSVTAVGGGAFAQDSESFEEIVSKSVLREGFFNFYLDESGGRIYLELNNWKQEFLYAIFLTAGVGSNDIGLDRGQIGGSKIVRFERFGPRVLLIQTNYKYRAESDNPDERKSVEEAFAQSVLGGFKVEGEKEGRVLIDLTEFIVRDAHGVQKRLLETGQGQYSLAKDKSALYTENIKNFPFNSEFEAILTFTGEPAGAYVKQVVPTAGALTVRQRLSFIALPDGRYKKRSFDPRAGYGNISYMDYAAPIEGDIFKRFIIRHRLVKKNPGRKQSEALKPIVYYVDRGAPEPIRSALIEGATWWNEAFEAAGFKDAFRVELLPDGADPLDVRYNVIQWVHRSTRGWSYGSSIVDPRTGEIIKGHVSLGSLRVRQDYLIAQGLLAPFEDGKPASDELKKMALARLRQLSAHEVGHTLGLSHNYISSTYNRGSVMDYPHPLILLDENGNIDLSEAYDTGVGEWDKIAIRYGYSQFSKKDEEQVELQSILSDGINKGIVFLSDQDARPAASAHPRAHLWDNGFDAAEELLRIMKVRDRALSNFGEHNIPMGEPLARLEDVLVPIYFLHRYQLEAAVKVIGGLEYNYALRGDGTIPTKFVDPGLQQKALEAALSTIDPAVLALDESIIRLIPPVPKGFTRGREHFQRRTGLTFDPLSAAETASQMTIQLLINTQKCARLVEFYARNKHSLSLRNFLDQIYQSVGNADAQTPIEEEIKLMNQHIFVERLIALNQDEAAPESVRRITWEFLLHLREDYSAASKNYLFSKINKYLEAPVVIEPSRSLPAPDGSPIGMGRYHDFLEIFQCTNTH